MGAEMMRETKERGPRDSGFPFRGYVFGPDGMHDGGEWLENTEELKNFCLGPLARAMAMRLEVMVCDNGDYAVFHAEDGAVTWDGIGLTR